MPVIHVEWFAGRTREQKQQLAEAITTSVSEIGGCTPADVDVVFQDVAKEDWAMEGKLSG